MEPIDWKQVQMLTRGHADIVRTKIDFERAFGQLQRKGRGMRSLGTVQRQLADLHRQLSRTAIVLIGGHEAYRWGSQVVGVGEFTLPGIMAEIGICGQARVRFPAHVVEGWSEARWVTHPSRLPPPRRAVGGNWRKWVDDGVHAHEARARNRELRALRVLWRHPNHGGVEVLEERWGIACFPTRSSLYRMCGMHVVFDERRGWIAPERKPLQETGWNTRLRTLLSSIGVQFGLRPGYFHDVFLAELDRQQRRPDGDLLTPAHAAARARRFAAKLYLRMLWQVWRVAEGHEILDGVIDTAAACAPKKEGIA